MPKTNASDKTRAERGRNAPGSSPSVAARRARGLRMLREGTRVKHVAELLGVSVTTVKRWQAAAKLGQQVAAEVETAEQARARVLERARERLAAEVEAAVGVVLDVMHYRAADELGDEEDVGRAELLRADSRVAKVQLQAALAVLDRAGLPKVTELKHEGSAFERLAQELEKALGEMVRE